MKKILFLMLCILTLLLVGCMPLGPREMQYPGLFYCDELNCYVKVSLEDKTITPKNRNPVLIAEDGTVTRGEEPEPYTYTDEVYRCWYVDQNNQTHDLDVITSYSRTVFFVPVQRAEEWDTSLSWIEATLKKSTEKGFVLRYRKTDNRPAMERMLQFDKNGDKKFVFNRVVE